MTYALLIIILAGISAIVWYIMKLGGLKMEKASLEKSKEALSTKTSMLETAALQTEAARRAKENQDVEAFDDDLSRSTTRFYPRVSDKDPNDLN